MSNYIKYKVSHFRITPKKYDFTHNSLWHIFEFRSSKDIKKVPYVSINKRGPISFREIDHISYLNDSIWNTLQVKYKKELGLIESIKLITNPRYLGYVFNPVSYYVIQSKDGKKHVIIEICNTYNEIKSYYAGILDQNNSLKYITQKNFYISPFTHSKEKIEFNIFFDDEKLNIQINSYENNEVVLKANLFGALYRPRFTFITILKSLFTTHIIITLIHMHAFILWIKKIPYLKKKDSKPYETEVFKWK